MRGDGKYSHCDAPLHGNGGRKHSFEVCAACTKGGKDRILGCATFQWFDGTQKKQFKDRGLRGMDGYTQYTDASGNTCYVRKSAQAGGLFRSAIKKWNDGAGKD